MDKPIEAWMSPVEKLGRLARGKPSAKHRPVPLALTADEQAKLDALSPIERLRQYRQWQAQRNDQQS